MNELSLEYEGTMHYMNTMDKLALYVITTNLVALLVLRLIDALNVNSLDQQIIALTIVIISLSCIFYIIKKSLQTVKQNMWLLDTNFVFKYTGIDLKDGKGLRDITWSVDYRDIIYVKPTSSCELTIDCVPIIREYFPDDTSKNIIYDYRMESEVISLHITVPKSYETDILKKLRENLVESAKRHKLGH